MTGIYLVTNLINNKKYVGQSTNIGKRWIKHRNYPFNPNCKEYNYSFYQAIRKYGLENFKFEVIEECDVNQLNEREIYWISYYDSFNNGYNMTAGGNSSPHFVNLNNEKLNKIRELLANTNLTQKQIAEEVNISEEMVQGINTGRYWKIDIEYPIRKHKATLNNRNCSICGKPITRYGTTGMCSNCFAKTQRKMPEVEINELLLKIYNSNFTAVGREYGVSDNTIRKHIAKFNIPTTKKEFRKYVECEILHKEIITIQPKQQQKKAVIQLDLNGQYIADFNSISDAARSIGKESGNAHISACCLGKRQTAYGYKWKYKEN